jgi:SAM-dependent methyltransferase
MDPDYERKTLLMEERHWWYRGRRAIVRQAVDKLALGPDAKILDAGCGSGRNMVELAAAGDVYGVDISPYSVEQARSRGLQHVEVGSLTELPVADDEFDLVTSLDVIEHIEDDLAVLRELLRVTRPGGALLVTVPAYPALWSSHDVVNQHQRRYTRRTLLDVAGAAGWRPEHTTHFNALLLPPAAAYRAIDRLRAARSRNGKDHDETHLDATPQWANGLLEKALLAEASLLRRGARRIPAGLSLMAILRKSDA